MLKISITYLSIWLHYFIWKYLVTKVQCSSSINDISSTTSALEPSIVNGYNCPIEEHPYMISIRITTNLKHFCGGSLISEYWILTAAHCCESKYEYGFFTACAGSSVISEKVLQKQIIARNYKHPGSKRGNDIGMMELAHPILQSDSVQYVHIANYLHPHEPIEEISRECIVMGWGDQYAKNESGDPISTPISPHNLHLQCANLTIIKREECKEKLGINFTEMIMCTYVEDNDACQGDTGAPLMCNEVQYGIVAFGARCASGYPRIFTRVDMYEDFIYDTISPRSSEMSIYKFAISFYIFTILNGCMIL